jgi:hypothetical protein
MKHNNYELNIDLFLLCYNEESMIIHTLNYYSKFCGKITILDNFSTDNSLDLVRTHFPNVEIKTFDTNGEHREDIMMEVRNNCWKNSTADYVIVCDMDEFLYAENLLEKLHHIKKQNISIPVIVGYNMLSENFPTDYNADITEQIKVGYRDRMFDKNIIFSPNNVKEINYGPGSHQCFPAFHTQPHVDDVCELKLLHYKYLNKEYLIKRHINYAVRMSDINKQRKYGFEYELGQDHINNVYESSYYLLNVLQ